MLISARRILALRSKLQKVLEIAAQLPDFKYIPAGLLIFHAGQFPIMFTLE
jgi:hypothetical protein